MHLVAALHRAWDQANQYYLKGALKPCAIGLSESKTKLGAWSASERTIWISRHLLATANWEQVVEVLRHEMAHQFVSEVLKVTDETPHGPAFRAACDRLGIDPVVAGLAPLQSSEHPVHSKVRKLLALAGSPNRHEAELAMARAQKLILRHNLTASPDRYTSRILGPRKLRFQRWEKSLVSLIGDHFFVRVMWVPLFLPERNKQGRAAEILGSASNLDLAEHAYAFIVASGERCWRTFATDRTTRNRGDRNSFLLGLIRGFADKLDAQRQVHEETGLVWVGDADLDRFVTRRYPHVRTERAASLRVTGAYQAGQEAGRALVLNKAVSAGKGGTRGLLSSS